MCLYLCPCVQVWSHTSAVCVTMQAAAGVTWRLIWTDTTQSDVTSVICVVKSSNLKWRWKATDWATAMKVRTLTCSVTDDVFCNAILVTADLLVIYLLSIYYYPCLNCTQVLCQTSRYLRKCKAMINKRTIILFVQGNGFNVRSVTSPRSLNLPCSDTWSNTLSLRSEYTHSQLTASICRNTLKLYYVCVNGLKASFISFVWEF